MAKAITLPLSEAQLLQKELATKQPNLYRDTEVDKALCLAYQDGSSEAGIKLIYRYLDKLSYIYRFPTRTKNRGGAKCKIDITTSTTKEDREDLFMEIIYHFLKLLLEYDPTEGDLQGLIIGKLHLRVFYYHYGDLIDLRMNEQELDDNYDMEEEMKEIFIDEKEVPEDVKRIYEILSELPHQQRQIAEMCFIKGWTAKEAASEIGITKGAAERARTRLVVKLKEQLEEVYNGKL
ncbi:RNA polymerase sigma factor [Bacillus toyonensis]|uniref:RNA polymerase sigma factor n=1 Tax=Bacillus toyonensis TaxID=155322 RepID=UPI000BF48C38|nr:sigma-70 family RNA polymerase sigma factor [Bacillus toyonensis]PGF00851.1 RNA polymerase subunit sigma-70 [Bacillus toyonensis]PHE47007.1 RNA polymerase subunit sigma-70 [Bacillus toyonensis]